LAERAIVAFLECLLQIEYPVFVMEPKASVSDRADQVRSWLANGQPKKIGST
jgi:hypothetical protein